MTAAAGPKGANQQKPKSNGGKKEVKILMLHGKSPNRSCHFLYEKRSKELCTSSFYPGLPSSPSHKATH